MERLRTITQMVWNGSAENTLPVLRTESGSILTKTESYSTSKLINWVISSKLKKYPKKSSSLLLTASLAVMLFLFSCAKDPIPEPLDFAYDLYPISVGDYRTYEVDSIVFNDFTGDIDSFKYQVQEFIAEEYKDLENRTSFKFHRLFRQNSSENWAIGDVWSITPTSQRLETREENIPYIKLIFPIEYQSNWDGNALNTFEDEIFEVKTFDSTATILNEQRKLSRVEHYNRVNLIERQSKQEIFARGIGPIYYQQEYVFRKTDGINFENDVDSGFTRVAHIIDYFVQ